MTDDSATSPTPSPLAAAIAGAPVIAEPSVPDALGQEPEEKGAGPGAALPEGCPVTALGMDGLNLVFLTAIGQLVVQPASKVGGTGVIDALFAPHLKDMAQMWPKTKRDNDGEWVETGEAHYAKVRQALIRACSVQGPWGGNDRARGVGTWIGPDGQLVLHQGDRIWIGPAPYSTTDSARYERPGLIGRYVYPSGPRQPRPAKMRGTPGAAAAEVMQLLGKWRWRRGDVDARLMLGWIGCAMIGGALDWRPHIWLTGPTGNGKSTLQNELIKPLLNDAVIGDEDTTPAALRGQLGGSSLPVILDENDPTGNDSAIQQLIKVIRVAAGGGRASRSSSGHEQHQTRLQSAALLASSLVPPLEPEDRNRIAILELLLLPDGAPPLEIDTKHMRQLGAELLLELVLRWPEWKARVTWWRQAITSRGHNGRGAAVYGTLLAAADLLSGQELPDGMQAVEPLLDDLSADAIADQGGAISDQQLCLEHLLTTRIEWSKGTRSSIGQLVLDVIADPGDDARQKGLREHGVLLERRKNGGGTWMLVANSHSVLNRAVYDGTKWQGGVWRQSLERLEGVEKAGNKRMGAVSPRCCAIPVDRHLLGPRTPRFQSEDARGDGDDMGL